MIRYADAMQAVLDALAAENGCVPTDLTSGAVRLCERPDEFAARSPLVRRYPPHAPAFAAVSTGRGTVLSASRALLAKAGSIFRGADRDQVFEIERLAAVNELLKPFALQIGMPHVRLLCGLDTLRQRDAPAGCRIEIEAWPSSARLQELGAAAWPHAISSQTQPSRPVAALALAWRGASIVGVAAIGDESPQLWQIGIDVAGDERGNGTGAALTAAIARHALEAGKAPWYGVAPANLVSIATALAAGFRLAWLDVFTYAR